MAGIFNVVSGQKAVASAGTAVQMVATTSALRFVRSVLIRADADNTVAVFAGNDNAGDVTVSNGFQLDAGESITLTPDSFGDKVGDEKIDLSSVWLDSASGTPGVHFIALL